MTCNVEVMRSSFWGDSCASESVCSSSYFEVPAGENGTYVSAYVYGEASR